MRIPARISHKEPVPFFSLDVLRDFHKEFPLAGNPQNALLSLSDELLFYLIAAIRNTPHSPPDIPPDEWHRFLSLLQPHGIIPLFAFHVRTWPEACRPPQEITEYLNRLFLLAAVRNLRAGQQIQIITNTLKDAGIPVILMKGHAFARTVYPDPALRQSSDIDLLVRPQNLFDTEEILEKLGYACPMKTHFLSFEEQHDIFRPPGNGLAVELHWVTDHAYDMVPGGWLDDAFVRRMPIRSGGLSCDTFSHPDHLLYLAFHNIFQHATMRLDWIYDTSLLAGQIRTADDWHNLGRQSVEHHMRIPMEIDLTTAALWTGCEFPGGDDGFSAWPAASQREERLMKHAYTPRRSLLSEVYLIMQGRHGIREKVRCGYLLFLPPTPLLYPFRKNISLSDIPLAHLRRWSRFLNIFIKK